jgi:hydroxyacylglutathione hydrolase
LDAERDLILQSFTLGPVGTNSYLVADPEGKQAAVVDPGAEGERIAARAEALGLIITSIWLTHAHFDHLGGVAGIVRSLDTFPAIALHPKDLPLWHAKGGAPFFGVRDFQTGPEPSLQLKHGQQLPLGTFLFEVRHTPGHSPGHVIFRNLSAGVVFCGDLIFRQGVGRVDLPGGDWETLLDSIRAEILTLPDDTTLYPGHGPATSVGAERGQNPFLRDI